VHNLIVLGVLYCLDNAFFAFSLGINSYLGRIAPPEDVTPSLVMGSTVNHIAAVGVPVVGGLLWSTVGYQVTFLAGAATCLFSVLSALAIRIEHAPAARRIPDGQPEVMPTTTIVMADGHGASPAEANRVLCACMETPSEGKRPVYERDE
jgi:hypothetical protein